MIHILARDAASPDFSRSLTPIDVGLCDSALDIVGVGAVCRHLVESFVIIEIMMLTNSSKRADLYK
jgi:hypothetical protein